MLQLALTILERIAFAFLILFAAFIGLASLLGYPGVFVVTAFSLAGLYAGVPTRLRNWVIASALAFTACVIPVWLLILYTLDGDFTVASLLAQVGVLGLLAYGFAWLGLILGRVVWAP